MSGPAPQGTLTEPAPHGEIQYSAVPAYLAQVQLGNPEPQPERPTKVLDLRQMTSFQGVLETGIEPVFPETGWNLETQVTWRRVGMWHDDLLHKGPIF